MSDPDLSGEKPRECCPVKSGYPRRHRPPLSRLAGNSQGACGVGNWRDPAQYFTGAKVGASVRVHTIGRGLACCMSKRSPAYGGFRTVTTPLCQYRACQKTCVGAGGSPPKPDTGGNSIRADPHKKCAGATAVTNTRRERAERARLARGAAAVRAKA